MRNRTLLFGICRPPHYLKCLFQLWRVGATLEGKPGLRLLYGQIFAPFCRRRQQRKLLHLPAAQGEHVSSIHSYSRFFKASVLGRVCALVRDSVGVRPDDGIRAGADCQLLELTLYVHRWHQRRRGLSIVRTDPCIVLARAGFGPLSRDSHLRLTLLSFALLQV